MKHERGASPGKLLHDGVAVASVPLVVLAHSQGLHTSGCLHLEIKLKHFREPATRFYFN